MPKPAARNESLLFAAATVVVAAHAAVDSFIAPEPGTGPGDHLARGLVTLALLGLVVAVYPRLRAGARAATAAALSALALEGAVLAVRNAQRGRRTRRGLDRVPARPGRPRAARARGHARSGARASRAGRAGSAGSGSRPVTVVGAYLARHAGGDRDPRHPPPPCRRSSRRRLGRPYEQVTLRTSDGLRLSGWYVPSRNGAAVIVSPGRSPQVQAPHARMLIRHGYGVLLFDVRGEAGKARATATCTAGRATRTSSPPSLSCGASQTSATAEIGGLGLSVGGEMLLQTAAETTGLKAVVSEGAGRRSLREHLHIPLVAPSRNGSPHAPVVQTGALMVMSEHRPTARPRSSPS